MSQASFDELLQCSICLERFTQPKLLPCSHTFCLSCLKGIIKDAETVDCPTCRRTHQVPEQGAAGFHDNLMAVNFLSMFGEINECADCEKKHSLSECEHCKLQVCGDCRVAHNVLLTEINVLIGVIQHDILQRPHDDLMKTACGILERTGAIEAHIHQVFNEASEILDSKKTRLLEQVQTMTKFQKALSQGNTEAIVEDIFHERTNRLNVYDLSAMKENLSSVVEMMSTPDWDIDFDFNMDEVAAFGKVKIIGTPSATGEKSAPGSGLNYTSASASSSVDSGAATPRPLETKGAVVGAAAKVDGAVACIAATGARGGAVGHIAALPNHPSLASARGAEACGNEAAMYLLPSDVDYPAKNACFRMQLVKAPCDNFSPTSAVYSPKEDAIYCISSYQVLKFDVKYGTGKMIPTSKRAVNLAMTESGDLMVATFDGQVEKLSLELLTHSDTNYENALQRLQGRVVNQLCCYGREFMILDNKKPCLSKFNETGNLIGEYILNQVPINQETRMCVGREGQAYIVTRREESDQERGDNPSTECTTCKQQLTSVKLRRKITVTTITGDGAVSGQLTLAKNFCYYCMANFRISGVCVDGDGYISVSMPELQKVEVYDPKGKLHCSIDMPGSRSTSTQGGLCMMPDGRMIVCDCGNKRILII